MLGRILPKPHQCVAPASTTAPLNLHVQSAYSRRAPQEFGWKCTASCEKANVAAAAATRASDSLCGPISTASLHSTRLTSSAAASTSQSLHSSRKNKLHKSRSGQRMLLAAPCPAQRRPQQGTAQEEDDGEADGFLDDEDDDEDDGFFDFEGEEEDDLLGLEADDGAPGISTGGESWAVTSLEAARNVLSSPSMQDLDLYLFRLIPGRKLDIRLDRLTDTYGSPSIEDIEKFSRMLYKELIAMLGEEAASEISLEVSSPGAERTLALPQDLQRFGSLPLRVEYTDTTGAHMNQALQLESYDETSGLTVWRLAEVKANAPGKGRGMNKKQKEARFEIPLARITRIRVFVDF
mmetsp:Transcript_19424/g.50414  ORF Transcript_19424/g.50414 Transcript_19424/m.50414 type:complete len:350 (+) Transcript_19424:1687-2736(+)|eukprot:CAMPEP_0202352120 /NCGR_PEP_ID=MMETSP1126-20121109/8451_1 /ASSEMBLY_ACC=CAM_ASM_000457 /TAXON_ID=3047 /ORGANISM="Dunaliella tertiolecta, Strain CCMP1320" /LENGTH=349 /DNA_ID=CAMNT_0048944291 /DNA_START=16 /DNA_END=1065 /DNA_ORIENTATION=-